MTHVHTHDHKHHDHDHAHDHSHHDHAHGHAHTHGPNGEELPLEEAARTVVSREILQVNIDELVSGLSLAFGEEFAGSYKFQVWANAVSGDARAILTELAETSWRNSRLLLARISELGGEPRPGDLSEYGLPDGTPYMPPNSTARAALVCALSEVHGGIRFYHETATKVLGRDHITYNLVSELLRQKAAHEMRIHSLLAG